MPITAAIAAAIIKNIVIKIMATTAILVMDITTISASIKAGAFSQAFLVVKD